LNYKVELELKNLHCTVQWPQSDGDELVLRCDVAPCDEKAPDLVQGWKDRCSYAMERELEKISVSRKQVPNQHWSRMKTIESEANFKADLMVKWDDDIHTVIICGLSDSVRDFRKIVDDALEKLQKEITKDVELNSHHIPLLEMIDDISHVLGKGVILQFKRLKTTSITIVTVTGQPAVVDRAIDAMVLISQVIKRIVVSSVISTESLLQFVSKQAVRAHLKGVMEQEQLKVLLENTLTTIQELDHSKVEEAISLIRSKIKEDIIDLNSGVGTLFQSSEWSLFRGNLSEKFPYTDVIVGEDLNSVVLIAVVSQFQGARVEISGFINDHCESQINHGANLNSCTPQTSG